MLNFCTYFCFSSYLIFLLLFPLFSNSGGGEEQGQRPFAPPLNTPLLVVTSKASCLQALTVNMVPVKLFSGLGPNGLNGLQLFQEIFVKK